MTVGVELTMTDLTQVNWYAAAAAAVYVVPPRMLLRIHACRVAY